MSVQPLRKKFGFGFWFYYGLLLFVPLSIFLELAHSNQVVIFIVSALAVLPLAGWIGKATEHLAGHFGPASAGLINATFGNVVELIICIMAVRQGLFDVVAASLTGSIIGNILLILGVAMLCGGLGRDEQRFSSATASTGSAMLFLAVVGFLTPAFFHFIAKDTQYMIGLSLSISTILLVCYFLSLVFLLKTHKHLFAPERQREERAPDEELWSRRKSMLVLTGSVIAVAIVCEFLVGSIEHANRFFGFTEVFTGVIIIAIVGNAAEHSTAVLFAIKDEMDLALNVALSSSIQVALFVAPLVIFLSYFMGKPMALEFTPMEVLAVGVSVGIASLISLDGKSNWFEGVQLLAVYLILAVTFFFLR